VSLGRWHDCRACSADIDFPSEQKIDDIAVGINGINRLLQKLGLSEAKMQEPHQELSVAMKAEPRVLPSSDGEPLSNYPTHFAEFIKSFVNDRGRHASSDIHRVITTLVDLVAGTDEASTDAHLSSKDQAGQAEHDLVNPYRPVNIPMPPTEDVIAILRWTKGVQLLQTEI
jgi:hypothetical protein